MSAPDYYIGLDIGTSSVKAIACTAGGALLNRVSRSYPLLEPAAGWREQDAEEIYAASMEAVAALLGRMEGQAPVGFGLSSAMHSLLAVDSRGRPLGNCITWADTRSWAQAERLHQEGRAQALYAATGTPVHPMSPLCKLMWLREHDPVRFREADRFITLKSYLLFRWCGRYLIDYSDASSTGLFDLEHKYWNPEALDVAGVSGDRLPEPVPTTEVCAILDTEVRQQLGPAGDAPVITGASDGCLANLGSQVLDDRAAALTIGTSGALRVCRPAPLIDPKGRLFNYILSEQYYICGGAVNNGAYLLQWFRGQFSPERDPGKLFSEAASLPAGAGGLLCLPYLLGERAPVWDGRARGAFVGLTDRHGPAHLLRAMLEGICFNLLEVAGLLEERGVAIREIFASGGFTRSPSWVQLLADIFGVPVIVDENEDASAMGAVLLARHALGDLPRLDEASGFARRSVRYVPDTGQSAAYTALFSTYKRLYPALKEVFDQLGEM